jgi:hypothetical protein
MLMLQGEEASVYDLFLEHAPELLLGHEISNLTGVTRRHRNRIISDTDHGNHTSPVLQALKAERQLFFSTGTGTNVSYTLQAVADLVGLEKRDARLIDLLAPVLAEVKGPHGIRLDDVSAPLPCTIVNEYSTGHFSDE